MRLDKAKIARATVRFLRGKRTVGQGVVVPGGLIVTAAHVVRWDGMGAMAGPLGDHYVEDVEVGGQKIRAEVYAAEPVSDIAVLGSPDDQGPLAEAFEQCLKSIEPVPICTADFPLMTPFAVSVRTHTGVWIDGRARQCGVNASALAIETDEGIESGTSGGASRHGARVAARGGLHGGRDSW
jgi:S1-C subfamily serine protease